MGKYTDSLRGYGYPIHQRDNFQCRYCGWNGRECPQWLFLSIDHLLPKGHPDRDNIAYIVTACIFCNVADNQYFKQASQRGLIFDGKTPDELIKQRLRYVQNVRDNYEQFWKENIKLKP